MSFWIEGTDRKGRRTVWAIDLPVGPLVVGLIFVYAPRLLAGPSVVARDGTAAMVVGFVCFAIAKASVIRRGIWTSFGSHVMTKWWSRLYRTGYTFMALGTFLLLVAYARA